MNLLNASKALVIALGGGHTTSQILDAARKVEELVAEIETRTKLRQPESWSKVEEAIRAQNVPPFLIEWVLLREEFAWTARERERLKDESGACLMWAAAERLQEIIHEKINRFNA